MLGKEGKYNIKAVSIMLGIQPGTLRAWERRYQVIAPSRNELGYRLYTEEQIETLKWLIKKVNQGFTIGQAVSLLENNQLKTEAIHLLGDIQDTNLSTELLEALLNFNEDKALEIINLLFSLFSFEKVCIEIFRTVLEKINHLQESGDISNAQELFAHSIIRSKIGMIFYNLPKNNHSSKALVIGSPGETEDTCLLIFSLFLRLRGLHVVFLGAGISENGLNEAVKMIGPNYLFLSCTMQANIPFILPIVSQFSLNYKNLRIGIGGKAVNSLKNAEKEQFSTFLIGQSINEWEKWLPRGS